MPTLTECAKCPLMSKGAIPGVGGALDIALGVSSAIPFVPPEGAKDAQIIIVGEGPGTEEVMQKRPFVGPSGHLLNHLLSIFAVVRKDVYITNTCLCYLKGFKVPEEVTTYCNKRLIEELNCLQKINKHRIIISLGNDAYKALTNDTKTITAARGFFTKTINGYDLMPTLHPAYILRQPEHFPLIQSDFRKAVVSIDLPAGPDSLEHAIDVHVIRNLDQNPFDYLIAVKRIQPDYSAFF